ncbi:putative SAM-dependent methyltransferase [Paratrimastix pyriformis]|uniref:SAM-dependent methyltransferase n=1 Tax=Paratrimastix pyriformis TaxID=342808 RepID=A0ABQ8UBZ5_9EUKA|nr:putative SAM-dependent methyltransferase [Paratrimastix pyriformis]
MEDVPPIVHAFYLGGRAFSFAHFLSVLTAIQHMGSRKQFFFRLLYSTEPPGDRQYWDLLKTIPSVQMIPVAPVDSIDVRGADGRVKKVTIPYFQHKADIMRLQELLKTGGVYMDLDVYFLRTPPERFFHQACTMGEEQGVGCCNGVIFARPGAPFLQLWWDSYVSRPGYDPTQWNFNSVVYPRQLALAHPGLLTVEPPATFFAPLWTPEGLREIFGRDEYRPPAQQVALHLWESAPGAGEHVSALCPKTLAEPGPARSLFHRVARAVWQWARANPALGLTVSQVAATMPIPPCPSTPLLPARLPLPTSRPAATPTSLPVPPRGRPVEFRLTGAPSGMAGCALLGHEGRLLLVPRPFEGTWYQTAAPATLRPQSSSSPATPAQQQQLRWTRCGAPFPTCGSAGESRLAECEPFLSPVAAILGGQLLPQPTEGGGCAPLFTHAATVGETLHLYGFGPGTAMVTVPLRPAAAPAPAPAAPQPASAVPQIPPALQLGPARLWPFQYRPRSPTEPPPEPRRGYGCTCVVLPSAAGSGMVAPGLMCYGGRQGSGLPNTAIWVTSLGDSGPLNRWWWEWKSSGPALWHHQLATLPSGDILCLGGEPLAGGQIVGEPCILRADTWEWRLIRMPSDSPSLFSGELAVAVMGNVVYIVGAGSKMVFKSLSRMCSV